jgi:hypothetical protein
MSECLQILALLTGWACLKKDSWHVMQPLKIPAYLLLKADMLGYQSDC